MLKKLLFLAALALFPVIAHAQAPNVIPGCVYNATPPTLADKQTVAIQCDSAGKLKTTGGSIGPDVATTCTALTLLYADAASLLQCSKTIPFSPTFAAGTITTSQPTTITQTWNAGGVTFTGLLANITNTASAAASRPLDIQVNSVSVLNVRAGGYLDVGNVAGGFSNTGIMTEGITIGTNSSIANVSGEQINGYASGTNGGQWAFGDHLSLNITSYFGWTSGAGNATTDVRLFRDAANTLAQRNGVNAQTLRIYGTFTDTSNGDWLSLSKAAGGAATISTVANGTGTAGTLTLGPAPRLSTGFTVAALPTAGVAGRRAYVTDQLTTCAVAGGALTGGGAVVCPVFDNGVAWVGD